MKLQIEQLEEQIRRCGPMTVVVKVEAEALLEVVAAVLEVAEPFLLREHVESSIQLIRLEANESNSMNNKLALTVLSIAFFAASSFAEDIRFQLANGGSAVVDVAASVEVTVLEQGVNRTYAGRIQGRRPKPASQMASTSCWRVIWTEAHHDP